MKFTQLIGMALLCAACSDTHNPVPDAGHNGGITDDDKEIQIEIEKVITVNGKTIDWTDYDKVYAFTNKNHHFLQAVGVNWDDHENIQYQAVYCSMICEVEMSGTAHLPDNSPDPEFDIDESGEYRVDSYCCQSEDCTVKVRIASECRSKACFVYDAINGGDECDPNPNLILKEVTWP